MAERYTRGNKDPESWVKEVLRWRQQRLDSLEVRNLTFMQQRRYLDEALDVHSNNNTPDSHTLS